ncbi:MAG: polar amino acid transport system substrate-binding protein [Paraglaciecola sp.]|jgi:polar amino acid transport system substrate-binding protein
MKKLSLFLMLLMPVLLCGCTESPSGEATKKVQLIFLSENWPPMSYPDDGKPTGMAVDVTRAIANELGVQADVKIQLWEDTYQTAIKTPNVVVTAMNRTPQREDHFNWIQPPLKRYKEYFYKKRGSNITINNFNDAKKYKIGTITDFAADQQLKALGFENIISYPTPEDAMSALVKGEVQLSIFGDFISEYIIKEIGYSVSDVLPVYKAFDRELYIVISKGTSAEVVSEWEQAFKVIRKNKTYYKIYEKWFLSHTL